MRSKTDEPGQEVLNKIESVRTKILFRNLKSSPRGPAKRKPARVFLFVGSTEKCLRTFREDEKRANIFFRFTKDMLKFIPDSFIKSKFC